jgi:hypothetical protein
LTVLVTGPASCSWHLGKLGTLGRVKQETGLAVWGLGAWPGPWGSVALAPIQQGKGCAESIRDKIDYFWEKKIYNRFFWLDGSLIIDFFNIESNRKKMAIFYLNFVIVVFCCTT